MNIQKAAAEMGRKGGKSGTGASKRRSFEHYSQASKLAWKKRYIPMPDRFWRNVDKRGENECWIWKAFIHPTGYGRFNLNGKHHQAHRIAYELHYGISVKDHVLHRCDNKPCCNPAHLFEGTNDDNVRDKMKKGRHRSPKGEQCHSHKLVESDIPKIRSDPRTLKEIAPDYGVHYSIIGDVKNRITWKHIP